jgi:hypothetical protein
LLPPPNKSDKMRTEGEFIFQSFEEAREFVSKPTNYEQEKNIHIINNKIILDLYDIKLIAIRKSDGTNTFVMFFKNSKNYDIWKFWIPSDSQLEVLKFLPIIITRIEEVNRKMKNAKI